MHGIPTPSSDYSSAEPAAIFPYRPCQTVKNLSHSLQQKAHRRSRHCSATDRVKMRQLTGGLHFLGGRLPCLLIGRALRDGHSVAFESAILTCCRHTAEA